MSMAAVSCVTTVWNGFIGAPGYTKLWFQEILDATARQAAVDAVRVFFAAQINFFKTTWSFQVSPIVQTFSLETGKLLREDTAGSAPPVVNGGAPSANSFFGGGGYVIKWGTGIVLDGRKVVGRTFMVPAINGSDADGTISAALISAAQAAGQGLLTNATVRQVVWHKRFSKPTDGSKPVYLSGNAVVVNSCTVPDRTAVMRSRRQ